LFYAWEKIKYIGYLSIFNNDSHVKNLQAPSVSLCLSMAHHVHKSRKYSLRSSKADVSDNPYDLFPQYQKECSFRFVVSQTILSLTKFIDKSFWHLWYKLSHNESDDTYLVSSIDSMNLVKLKIVWLRTNLKETYFGKEGVRASKIHCLKRQIWLTGDSGSKRKSVKWPSITT